MPPTARDPTADLLAEALMAFFFLSLPFLVFFGALHLTFAGFAWFYGVPVKRCWALFWGPAAEFRTLIDWVDLRYLLDVWSYHVERLFSWSWIHRYWSWPIWVSFLSSLLLCLFTVHRLIRRLFKSSPSKERDLTTSAASRDLLGRGVTKKHGIFAGRYHGRDFYVRLEDRGLVIGPSRTGKTAFLVNQLLKASANQLSFIAVDIKPELAAILSPALKQKGYRVLCFNPLAETTEHYNPLEDIHDETAIQELVVNLLPYLDSRDKPFTDAKRDYLRSALLHLQSDDYASLPLAYELITRFGRVDDYLQVLGTSASATARAIGRRLTAGLTADPLVGLGFAAVGREIDYFAYPSVKAAFGYSDFSLAELGQARPVALFVQFQETRLETMGAILSALYGHSLHCLIDNHGERQAVALFYDEIGNLPPIAGLTTKLNTLASRQLPTWTYWQSTSQMPRKYGPHADDLFFAAADLQLFFRTQDADTQALVSRLIGTTHEPRRTHTHSPSGFSETWGRQRVNVIEPHEVGELREGEVITLYRGGKAQGWAPPYYQDYRQYLNAARRRGNQSR